MRKTRAEARTVEAGRGAHGVSSRPRLRRATSL